MLQRKCDVCRKSIRNEKNLELNLEFRENFKKFDLMMDFKEEVFCDSCIDEISEMDTLGKNEAEVDTKQGIMRIYLKKKKNQFTLEIKNKKFRYPLVTNEFNLKNEAELEFFDYLLKLKNDQFKIIRNVEALDENYRRVFSRIKYGILFLD